MSEFQDLEKRGMGILRAAEADAGETFLRYEAYSVFNRYMGWLSLEAESSADADQLHWHLWRRLAALPSFGLRECWSLPLDCPWIPSRTERGGQDRKFLRPSAAPFHELNFMWYDAAHRSLPDSEVSTWEGAFGEDVRRLMLRRQPSHAFLLSWRCSFVPAFSWGASCEFEMWGAERGFPLWPSIMTREGWHFFRSFEGFTFPKNNFELSWFPDVNKGEVAAEPHAFRKLLMGP